jgi:2-hydroxychromene-2-carboxylate isomerase
MTLSADLFFSYRSPYSYYAVQRWRALVAEWDVNINLRPVYPLAVRQPDFFERNHPNWFRYLAIDVLRLSQFLDIPFRFPNPDPIVQDIATRKIAAEQPHIYRLTRLGQAAARRGKAFDFAAEVSTLIWGGTAGWNEGAHLAGAAMRAGLDLAELDAALVADADTLDKEIAANQAALDASGHWGVPTLVFNKEPFFGQDRIDLALWRMQAAGLARR